MTGRSKKLDISSTPTPAATFDDLIKEASETEKPVEEPIIGAKDGVFTPPKPEPVMEIPKKEVKNDKIEEKPSLETVLTEILNVPKGKRAVPSWVSFFSVRSNAYRHVIVDINDSVIDDAWKKYLEIKGPEADEEEFMGILYKITNTDVPRMYRAVAPVVLKK